MTEPTNAVIANFTVGDAKQRFMDKLALWACIQTFFITTSFFSRAQIYKKRKNVPENWEHSAYLGVFVKKFYSPFFEKIV